MRENPDTSLKMLRLLANEERYPSRLTLQDFASQLQITEDERFCTSSAVWTTG